MGLNISNWTASDGGVTANHFARSRRRALQTCTTSTFGPPANTTYYVQVLVTGRSSAESYPGIPANVPVSGKAMMRVVNQ